MQEKFTAQLDQAVKDGKLTQAQRDLILAKRQELQNKRTIKPENWETMTPEQRLQIMQKQRQELKSWATQNNIDLKYLFGLGLKSRRGFK